MPELNTRELAAILAGLRNLQQDIIHEELALSIKAIMDDSKEVKPLTVDEIDELCERLNK